MSFSNLIVIPAKAGSQGSSITAVALDPRFREGDDNLSRLHAVFPDGHLAHGAAYRLSAAPSSRGRPVNSAIARTAARATCQTASLALAARTATVPDLAAAGSDTHTSHSASESRRVSSSKVRPGR